MCEENIRDYVSPGDIFSAIKTLHGEYATVLEYDVKRATTSVQGFTSLMLRVNASVKLNENAVEHTSIIVKRMPVLSGQNELIEESNMFKREVTYFSILLPLLQKESLFKLPIVDCYHLYDITIIMEDLCQSGYKTLGNSMKDVGKNLLEISHLRLVMRKLAQIHVASLNINWNEICYDLLKTDAMFDNSEGEIFKNMVNTACKTITIIMKELYPNKYEKYTKWLLDPKCYNTMRDLCKYDSNFINVLCHGDFWINNMMFKIENNKPIDVKFIDLQIFRYAPPTTDVLYFLYTCTNKKFRDKYELEILKCYVEAFNTYVCETPDRIVLETFQEYYNKTKILGICFAIAMKPMLYMDDIFPAENEDMSQEHFETIMFGDISKNTLQQFNNNLEFRKNMIEVVDETMEVMDKLNIV